jgi:hypothetical protein
LPGSPPPGNLDFEPCDLVLGGGDPGNGVTGQQAQSEPVRILKNDRVVHRQAS